MTSGASCCRTSPRRSSFKTGCGEINRLRWPHMGVMRSRLKRPTRAASHTADPAHRGPSHHRAGPPLLLHFHLTGAPLFDRGARLLAAHGVLASPGLRPVPPRRSRHQRPPLRRLRAAAVAHLVALLRHGRGVPFQRAPAGTFTSALQRPNTGTLPGTFTIILYFTMT